MNQEDTNAVSPFLNDHAVFKEMQNLSECIPPTAPPRLGFSDSQREAIFQDLQPLIKRLLRQYGDTIELRKDLQGEIYSRFCELLDNYDPLRGIPLYSYLIRKLTLTTYSFARSQWRLRQRQQGQEIGLEGLNIREMELIEAWKCPIEGEIVETERQLLLQQLQQEIDQLTLRQRQVVTMRYYEDHSYDVIAEKLGIKPSTARSLLRHALDRLRQKLSQNG